MDFNDFYIQEEAKLAISMIKMAMAKVQKWTYTSIDQIECIYPVFLYFTQGLERFFKVIMYSNYKLCHGVYPPKILIKDSIWKSHIVSELLKEVVNISKSLEYNESNVVVKEDLEYMEKEEFLQIVKLCDYLADAKKGRYYNFNKVVFSENYEDILFELVDYLSKIIWDKNDPNWKIRQDEEMRQVSCWIENEIKEGRKPKTIPPKPYEEKMVLWLIEGIIIPFERILRGFSFLFTWKYVWNVGGLCSEIFDFAALKDENLGKMQYQLAIV